MNVAAVIRAASLLTFLLTSGCVSDVKPSERNKVLWVDDKPDGNREETAALRKSGLQVVAATSNAQAAELFRMHRYVLIISDIRREGTEPSTAGLELPALLRRIRADLPPVIYYVGHVERPYTDEGQPVVSKATELLQLVESRVPRSR